ncbi:MAG TPA: hypothetical protein EYH30_10970 [Anaerolineales bacterium]|nr:hypothetical protein [Anaerolineales bacterium]HIQ02618.1 hypothetical protein [Anaerolineales bacterium]
MDWIKILYSDAIPWLLEPGLPSVRYWTLTRLLDRPPDALEVVEARRQIMERGPAVEILRHYAGNGRWEGERSYYTYKYTSTHWQLLLLAELGADGQDERIAAACQRMTAEIHRERRPIIWPCFHGNLVGYLHALGHGEDERVRQFEGDLVQAGLTGKWQCELNGHLPCAWGAARALWGFSHIPPSRRSPEVEAAIQAGVRLLGRFRLRDGNYPTATKRHNLWDRLNFPLFYQADVLFILRVLADLDHLGDKPTFRRAVTWLESRCRDDGRWNGVSPYRRRMWTPLEQSGRPSKWVTWQALYVLKRAG